MMWAAVFVICMPDALRGDVCVQAVFDGLPGFTSCEVQRPAMRRILLLDAEAAGLGAASIDAGRCEPAEIELPGVAA